MPGPDCEQLSGAYTGVGVVQFQTGDCEPMADLGGSISFSCNGDTFTLSLTTEFRTTVYSGTISPAGDFTGSATGFLGDCQLNGTIEGHVGGGSLSFVESIMLTDCCTGNVLVNWTANKNVTLRSRR